ncbi:Uncharacterised protein [Klebsiella pneumoniae]|nr:Uncharacterised protein [Klebsiella pneumoniae]
MLTTISLNSASYFYIIKTKKNLILLIYHFQIIIYISDITY